MRNMLHYVKNNREPFSILPFNAVDALVLSWLSYFCYPDYLKGERAVALQDFEKTGLLPDEEMYKEAFIPKKSKKLFALLSQSPRFLGITLSDYRERRDEEEEEQFAALCIEIEENVYFLSFRGTDPSFVGWKEDFNFACMYPVPSQRSALEYTVEQMQNRPCGKFILGGHSKGGNMAFYTAVNLEKDLQNRILCVYSFDGPGFMPDISAENGYGNVEEKLYKIVPQASFVGMLFQSQERYTVVKSKSFSVLQHNPFCWIVEGRDFIFTDRRTKTSVRLERAVNRWIREPSAERRERIIAIIYRALNALDTKDFNVFFRTLHRQIPALYREYKRLEGEEKQFFDAEIKKLRKYVREEFCVRKHP